MAAVSGKMPLKSQPRRPLDSFDTADVRSQFVSSINISANKLYESLKVSEEQKLSGEFDTLNVSLSNREISFSPLVKFLSDEINVLVDPNEPISFGVDRKSFRWLLMMMAIGKEIPLIYLAYQPEEKKLILADAKGQMQLGTVPCTKNISESLLHLKLDNSPGC